MSYSFLAPPLQPTADAAKKYFKDKRGISKFKIEETIEPSIDYRPTLSAIAPDQHYICIEVSTSPYSNTLDAFVLDCMNQGLPVKLYVAMPKGPGGKEFKTKLQRAKRHGVGVFEVDGTSGEMIQEALSLSLTGLRPADPREFPSKFRSDVSDAETSFRNGNPAKGCSLLYDEIEALTRRIAIKTKAKGYWRSLKKGERPPKINLEKGPWATVMRILMEHLDYKKCSCPGLDDTLLARVRGLTAHRNESGHKPRSHNELKKRNRELRTRFENAVDILLDLITATKPLRP